MAHQRPLRYRGFSRPKLPLWARALLVACLAVLTAYTLYVCGAATVDALQGAGDPEVIWPAIAVLAALAFLLGRAAVRLGRALDTERRRRTP